MSSDELRQAGLKVTMPRMRILEILENSKQRHMSAEEIHGALTQEGDDVGLATVYRVLTQFEAAGLLTRHNFEEGRAVYELDQGEHHDHMVCVQCGQVTEFVDDVIESRQEAIAAQHQFQMTDHNLIIYGTCQTCA